MKYLKLKLDRADYFVTLVLIVIYLFLTLKTIHALPEEAITENINGELLDKEATQKIYTYIFWGWAVICIILYFYTKTDPNLGILDPNLNLGSTLPDKALSIEKIIPGLKDLTVPAEATANVPAGATANVPAAPHVNPSTYVEIEMVED